MCGSGVDLTGVPVFIYLIISLNDKEFFFPGSYSVSGAWATQRNSFIVGGILW
jgi:hypothetical protein